MALTLRHPRRPMAPLQSSAGPLTIAWDTVTPPEWSQRLKKVPRSNLLQTFAYGRAIRLTRQLMPRFGLIRVGEEEVGLVQIQEAGLLGLHTIVLDRGPLWYADAVPALWWRQFFDAFIAAFPRRLGRMRRIMPELQDNLIHRKLLDGAGLRLADEKLIGHRSIWVDLTADDGARRAGLMPNWRNHLTQGERAGLEIEADESGRLIDWIIAQYAEDKARRGYPGPAPKLAHLIAQGCFAEGQGLILRALERGRPVSGVLMLGHGRSATYQIGWTGEAGRGANATHVLLWEAMNRLAAKGIKELDLGGINPEQAEGLTTFKKGIGGRPYEIVPIFR